MEMFCACQMAVDLNFKWLFADSIDFDFFKIPLRFLFGDVQWSWVPFFDVRSMTGPMAWRRFRHVLQ